MTAAEKLERAKNGDRSAYDLLCGESADGLYAVALFTLGRSGDAREAVLNAFRDGYARIAQIRDGAHLRAWLARELTKHLVAKIKELRAEGTEPAGTGPFAALPSLDRIVCALAHVFHYSVHEISVITGLPPETVERKLSESERKLGAAKEPLSQRIAEIRFPGEKQKKLSVPAAVSEARQKPPKPSESEEPPKTDAAGGKPLDARTFIGVVSAQRIKGKDFLQLIGNTRISNDVYREIRENPNLTKERLISLLESSPLTSEDYYKLLSAVKQRSELLEWKEKKEERRKRTEAADQSAAGGETAKKTPAARTDAGTSAPAPKKKENRAEKTGPFTPLVNTGVIGRLSGEADEPEETDGKRQRAALPKKPDAPAPEVFRPVLPDFGDEEETERPRREKYKGKEYFIDDDVYYRGVNNGKLAFCAVCMALLFAGSFGIRFLTTGSALPTGEAPPVVTPAPPPAVIIESDADVLSAAAEMKSRVQRNALLPYRTGAEPYSAPLTDDFRAAGDTLYFLRQGSLRAVSLSPENPSAPAELPLSADGALIGFTAREDRVYLVYDEDGAAVRVEVLDKALSPLGVYRQDGRYAALRIGDGLFTLITSVTPEGGRTVLPGYRLGDEAHTLGYEEIALAGGAVCGGFSVIGTVSGGEARVSAVLGGYDTYAAFDGDRIMLILPDWNTTHLLRFRLIGTGTELLSEETVRGECYGADCVSAEGDCIVSYNSAKGHLIAQKKTEEGYALLEGFAPGERLSGVSFLDGTAYIVTETESGTKLYCVDFTGAEPAAAEANPNAVYYEKLAGFGESLIGLSAESDADGNRTALLLTVYGYEKTNGLSALRSARITVDENTAPEYARYLSGDAEENSERIAVSEDGRYAAVSYVAFDGISEIERFVCYADNGSALEKAAELSFYDIQSADRFTALRDGVFYAVTDHLLTAVELSTGEKKEFRLG